MNESDWIQSYIAPLVTTPGAVGLTDDVALLKTDGPMIATMDTLVEAVHFLPEDPLDTVGKKLLRVNVSDCLAKGARPSEALLSIAWPKHRLESEFAEFMRGLAADLTAFQVALIGGDLVATDGPLTVTMTLTGICFNAMPVRRSGGQPGQTVWVNGEICWGGIGLAAARNGRAGRAAERYRVPSISDLEAAQSVADFASASMDVSDGLLIDASRLAKASGCGVSLSLDRVPLAVPSDSLDDILAQCSAGDDYRILISAPANCDVPGFTKIGTLTEMPGLQLFYADQPVNPPSTLGFEHT